MKTLCGFAVAVWFATAGNSWATQRYVPGGGSPSYSTIQAAVNASAAGDVVRVQPGIYDESVIFRSVDITLTSTNPSGSQCHPKHNYHRERNAKHRDFRGRPDEQNACLRVSQSVAAAGILF